MYKLPFPVASNNNELVRCIEQFDGQKYQQKIEAFQKETGMFEDGRASMRVADLIEKKRSEFMAPG